MVVPTKTRKKSNRHGSGNSYFLRYLHLSTVARDVWLRVRLRGRQGKHRENKYCMGTVVAEGQRDAFAMDGLHIEHLLYNKYHEWTPSPMNKCRATGRRKYAFPDQCVIVFFHVVICTATSHNIGHF